MAISVNPELRNDFEGTVQVLSSALFVLAGEVNAKHLVKLVCAVDRHVNEKALIEAVRRYNNVKASFHVSINEADRTVTFITIASHEEQVREREEAESRRDALGYGHRD